MLIFKPSVSLSSFTFVKRLFSSSLLSAIRQKLPLVILMNINYDSTPACGSVVKNLPANAGDAGSTPTLEDLLEKEMVTHSSVLPWRIPWTVESGGLQSLGSHRVGHD